MCVCESVVCVFLWQRPRLHVWKQSSCAGSTAPSLWCNWSFCVCVTVQDFKWDSGGFFQSKFSFIQLPELNALSAFVSHVFICSCFYFEMNWWHQRVWDALHHALCILSLSIRGFLLMASTVERQVGSVSKHNDGASSCFHILLKQQSESSFFSFLPPFSTTYMQWCLPFAFSPLPRNKLWEVVNLLFLEQSGAKKKILPP